MKTLLAFAGAVILGYLVYGSWLESEHDTEWLSEAHGSPPEDTEFLNHLPHP